MLNQSFPQTLVVKDGLDLLAPGGVTTDLANGQLGIFDASTHLSLTAPTFATNPLIYLALGTPNMPTALMTGFSNETEKTKLIHGKKIYSTRVKGSAPGEKQIVYIGYDEDTVPDIADNKTLCAKCGEEKSLYIRITGTPVSFLHTDQGIIRRYVYKEDCCPDGCPDSQDCPSADISKLVAALVAQINADREVNKFITASVVTRTVGPTTVYGIKLVDKYVEGVISDCLYDHFVFTQDVVHIEASEYDPNYNSKLCKNCIWPITDKGLKYPIGDGRIVRDLEIKSKGYWLQDRSVNPAVRLAEGYFLNTDPALAYTQHALEYSVDYPVLGWSNRYEDRHIVNVHFKTGHTAGTAFGVAIANYIASVQSGSAGPTGAAGTSGTSGTSGV